MIFIFLVEVDGDDGITLEAHEFKAGRKTNCLHTK